MTSLKAKMLTSFILLFVLLFLPDKAASQRPRRRVTGSDAAQNSLPRTPTAKSDTLRIDSVTPFLRNSRLKLPLSTNLPTLWSLLSGARYTVWKRKGKLSEDRAGSRSDFR